MHDQNHSVNDYLLLGWDMHDAQVSDCLSLGWGIIMRVTACHWGGPWYFYVSSLFEDYQQFLFTQHS